MPIDWTFMGWLVLLAGLSATAAMIGRTTASLFLRASRSRVTRRRA